jgi:hypothetical protein
LRCRFKLPAQETPHLSNRRKADLFRSRQSAAMKAGIIPVRRARKLPTRVSNGSRKGYTSIAIKKILALTDFSPASEKGLKYALRFAREFGAEVMLLHILEPIVPLRLKACRCGCRSRKQFGLTRPKL